MAECDTEVIGGTVTQCLTTGGADDSFLPKILLEIRHADEIMLAVAFIKNSGLNLLFSALADFIERKDTKLTILTSDYLDVTDPAALRRLMLFAERGANVNIFQTECVHSFHLKAYIFIKQKTNGAAFIGSSNISKTALTNGIEWNYKVAYSINSAENNKSSFKEILEKYQLLISHKQVVSLDYDWIDDYESRRKILQFPVDSPADDVEPSKPLPLSVQEDALKALDETRKDGYCRGLVVMATGLGKTYLAAFDTKKIGAKRILFVAHREEILLQAEATFLRIHPSAKVGHYTGKNKDENTDMLFASVQTLGKKYHLNKFPQDHFDYVIVDEFHHAAAVTYRKLLSYFKPKFMLGLTATPERTDQSDILSLCDDNLVFSKDLFYGINNQFLCPFTYFGIYDETVDYTDIPWRNGKFDIDSLNVKFATHARAKHVLRQWTEKKQNRTLAFCVSKIHADFMANQFKQDGVRAVAVHSDSDVDRFEALEQLDSGKLDVIFSVDLFNEGVDLPTIDTVMMLRPSDSKILFLQQLGRGLRTHEKKERLIILDFIGNHKSFLNKPQALFGIPGNYNKLSEFARHVRDGELKLPAGCYVNYDIEIIDFLANLASKGPERQYQILKDSLGRRPTLTEYFKSGASLQDLRNQFDHWWDLVKVQGDLSEIELQCIEAHGGFYKELQITSMTKSFKAVLLESLLENRGFIDPPSLEALADQSLTIFRRRRNLIFDIRQDLRDLARVDVNKWQKYWKGNPVNAWVGGNMKDKSKVWFEISNGIFRATFKVSSGLMTTFQAMLQELVDFLYSRYLSSKSTFSEDSGITFPNSVFNDRHQSMESNNLAIGHDFMREDIPTFFGEVFNRGNWNSGHVVLNNSKSHILFVTLNKRGRAIEHRYLDYFSDDNHVFHWQSQNSTTPESKKGSEIINHREMGVDVHLFVREHKLANGKGAPFKYYGLVKYQRHSGSAPMNVEWSVV